MTPVKFTSKNGVITFHYPPSELIKFVRLGFKHGDVGMILVRRKGDMLTFKGFGTIESPCKHIQTISMMHNPFFDGEMISDEERLIPPKGFFTTQNTEYILLDLKKVPHGN